MKALSYQVLIGVALTALASVNSPAQIAPSPADSSSRDEREIRTAMEEIRQAFLHSDAGVIDRLYTDDYTLVHTDGSLGDKREAIAGRRNHPFSQFDREDVRIRLYDKCAITTFILSWRGTFEGEVRSLRERVTQVWVQQNGVWRVAANHATKVP